MTGTISPVLYHRRSTSTFGGSFVPNPVGGTIPKKTKGPLWKRQRLHRSQPPPLQLSSRLGYGSQRSGWVHRIWNIAPVPHLSPPLSHTNSRRSQFVLGPRLRASRSAPRPQAPTSPAGARGRGGPEKAREETPRGGKWRSLSRDGGVRGSLGALPCRHEERA